MRVETKYQVLNYMQPGLAANALTDLRNNDHSIDQFIVTNTQDGLVYTIVASTQTVVEDGND